MSLKDTNIHNPRTRKHITIVMAGSQASIFAVGQTTDPRWKFTDFYEDGKIAAPLSHGVAIIVSR